MTDTITLVVLAGTTREGRRSIKAARYVADFARRLENVEVIFVDPADFVIAGDGDNGDTHNPDYAAITAKADAFYIVTPEYNHSIPGSLKRLLDSEYDNYFHKPVGLAGVSNGSWGGVRVCEALLPVMHTMGMPVIKKELYFPRVQDMFDEQGKLAPGYEERYQKNLRAVFDELLWFAKILKTARAENQEN
jgi:NAD(P)H-dependent FMN reductase